MSQPPAFDLPFAKRVPVPLGQRRYDIAIENGLIDRVIEQIQSGSELKDRRRFLVITDQTVGRFYGDRIQTTSAIQIDKMTVEDGEPSKSVKVANRLWQQMLELGVDRQTVVVALGGGVVGDLAGFVAASFMRGLDYVQIPTSLLAQVDSSVGGKVGINLPKGKNLVGAFLQPKHVIIDPQVLTTLDERNYKAGLAEVIKYGVILDADFFSWLEENVEAISRRDSDKLGKLIARCCTLKAQVVVEDEKETTGRRAILNYGHTLGHAIEATAGYGQFLHGEAITTGMDYAAKLSMRLGRVNDEFVRRQQALFERLGLQISMPDVEPGLLVEAMGRDKKSSDSKINMVLPNRIGSVELVHDVSSAEILSALRELMG